MIDPVGMEISLLRRSRGVSRKTECATYQLTYLDEVKFGNSVEGSTASGTRAQLRDAFLQLTTHEKVSDVGPMSERWHCSIRSFDLRH